MDLETIWRLMGAIGPLIILFGIFLSAFLVRRQMKLTYDLAIRNKSVGYSLYANEHLRDSRLSVEREFGSILSRREVIPLGQIDEKRSNAPEIYADMLTLLAHWENMCLSIEFGIADEDVCFEMVATTMVRHVHIFREFIADRQQINARAYRYLITVQRRWSDRLSGWEEQARLKPIPPV